jgi:hypothetical protein
MNSPCNQDVITDSRSPCPQWLEYEEENQVAIPIPPPSLSPVRGQHSTRAHRWGPYPGHRRPVRGMQTTDLNAVFGSDFHAKSAVVPGHDHAPVSDRSRELVPVESVDVNDLTALTLLSVWHAEVALMLVTSLSDRMAEWTVERNQTRAQASLDLARERLRAEVSLALAQHLEEARVTAMVDEETAGSALEEVEGTASVDEAYWGEFQG